MKRTPRIWALVAVAALLGGSSAAVPACSGSDSVAAGSDAGAGGHELFCSAGTIVCEGSSARTCDGKGGFSRQEDCAADHRTCTEALGCLACVPGTGLSCHDGKATGCRADGVVITFECDPTQGMVCEPDGCKGKCSPTELGPSYVGCDYYPTATLNPVWSGFDFAVAVANTDTVEANVTVTRSGATVASAKVAPGALGVVKLPWVAELKGGDVDACQTPPPPGATRVVAGGAFRLRSDVPVTVYQFSPLSYAIDPPPAACPVGTQCPGGLESRCKSFSNDASLLLPATTLTGEYVALAWPSSSSRAGFIAITATADGTVVELDGVGELAPGAGLDASGKGKVTLGAGDVLEVVARSDVAQGAFGADLSGTQVHASRPVQVIAGHSCANVPQPATGYCDHLEESVFPVETLGTDYLVTFPGALGAPSPHVVRVLAIEAQTHVRFDPPVVADQTLGPKAPFELSGVTKDVHVISDKPVLVAQYMQGSSSVPSGLGDPSLSFAIATEQFRTTYLFIAPETYDTSYVNVIAPSGASVRLDGADVPAGEFESVGASSWSVARHLLAKQGVHEITSASRFGVVVYGYGKDTSYMYPGGLDLKQITVPPPR